MQNNSIFWVEVDKVRPNPYQPRRDFDEARLRDLSESVRQYGILQPLVVTRHEEEKEEGGLAVYYELIAGERRLRAARLANLVQVPVIIRNEGDDEEGSRIKLELAIIENVQREDLNPIERARAFKRLVDEFGFQHVKIALKIGKSREYVSNSIRLLSLPEVIVEHISDGKLSEGHARPLMMLAGKDEEQATLHKEILLKKLTVREAERIARHIAHERARKRGMDLDPEILELERALTSNLGTRVQVEQRENGGRLVIDFMTVDEAKDLLKRLSRENAEKEDGESAEGASASENRAEEGTATAEADAAQEARISEEDELYSVRNFTI